MKIDPEFVKEQPLIVIKEQLAQIESQQTGKPIKRCKRCKMAILKDEWIMSLYRKGIKSYYDKTCWAKEKKENDKERMFKGYKKGPWKVVKQGFGSRWSGSYIHIAKKWYFMTKKEALIFIKSLYHPEEGDILEFPCLIKTKEGKDYYYWIHKTGKNNDGIEEELDLFEAIYFDIAVK